MKIKGSIKGFNNPEGRKALADCFNGMIKERLKEAPMSYEELNGYLNAVGDIYLFLTKTKKMFKFDKEIRDIQKGLETGKIIVLEK